MLLYFYATCVAAVIFLNLSATTPVPQVAPTYVCPHGTFLQNNVCVSNIPSPPIANQPVDTTACSTPGSSCLTPCTPTNDSAKCATNCPNNCSTNCATNCVSCQTQTTSCSTHCCSNGATNCCPCNSCCPCNKPCQESCSNCHTSCRSNCVPHCTNYQSSINCNTIIINQGATENPISSSTVTPTTPTSNEPTEQPNKLTELTTERPCPEGTIRIKDTCHLIYCPHGVYRNGKCTQIFCPSGTVWTGSRCENPQPQNYTLQPTTNVIITKINQTDVNRSINSTNNIEYVYITESPFTEGDNDTDRGGNLESNCCLVTTPISCFWVGNRYRCKNRNYRQCGQICTSVYINLIPPIVYPPPREPQPCRETYCHRPPFYPDCSECYNQFDTYCATYCRRTVCQSRTCQPIGLRDYCSGYPGSIGCRPIDGCEQGWCRGGI